MTPDSTRQPPRITRGLELWVSGILLGGVALSALLLLIGYLWGWVEAGRPSLPPTLPRTNLGHLVVSGVASLGKGRTPESLVDLGIAVLLLTPYLRVIASMIHFLIVERDPKYVLITGFVGGVLTYSLFF